MLIVGNSLMIILPLCTMASVNNQPEINLVNVEDSVIPVKSRTSILEVAEMSLDRSDEAFAMSLEEVKKLVSALPS